MGYGNYDSKVAEGAISGPLFGDIRYSATIAVRNEPFG